MKKLLAATAAALVAIGLTACSEEPAGERPTVPVVPSAPAPAPAVPTPDLGDLPSFGGMSPEDLIELQRQLEELGIDVNDPSSLGLDTTDLEELQRQLEELGNLTGSGSGSSSGTSDPGSSTVFSDADAYGDDPHLDALWDSCAGGDMAACDDLYMDSPWGSEYEEFANNCGTAGNPDGGFCD